MLLAVCAKLIGPDLTTFVCLPRLTLFVLHNVYEHILAKKKKNQLNKLYSGVVWIRLFARLRIKITFHSFFFFFKPLQVPQTSLFNHFFIKNWSHGTIHTFKNYFTTVFSVFSFSKINSIQTDPR